MLIGDGNAAAGLPTADCPITLPSGSVPPNERPGDGWHGNGAIWVGLPIDGTFSAPPEDPVDVGPPAGKIVRFRDDSGAESHIHGHSLLDPTLEALVERPHGCESHVQVSAVTFPGNGCWVLHPTTMNAALTVTLLIDRRD